VFSKKLAVVLRKQLAEAKEATHEIYLENRICQKNSFK
jgi:hypothetical protein